ncbi:MAG: ABC transporter permease [Elusimicrobiota bacterium]
MKKVLIGFIKKEFAQTLRDPVMRVFLFVAPVIQLLIFGFAINTDFKNLNLAVIHSPSDRTARQLSDRIYSTGWFNRIEPGRGDPMELMQTGKTDAVLIAPAGGIDKEAARGAARIQLLIDAQNATKARAVESYIQNIAAMFLAARRGGPGMTGSQVKFDVRVLYNPAMETPLFMIPGIMTMIMCIATIMLTSMSIAREKELGTFESIIAAPLSNVEIILGKTIPFIIIGLIDAVFIMGAGMAIFGMPVRGSFLLLFLATFIFVCTTVSIGTLISTFARNQQQAMMGTFIFVFPAMLMSGVFFPVENMPIAIKWLAYIDPLKYFITLLRNVMLKGNIPELFWPHFAAILLIMFASVFVASRRFRQTLN